jgi:hypothetical protein
MLAAMGPEPELFASTHHGIITRGKAAELGLGVDTIRQRLESGRWLPIYESVYRVAGAPPTWLGDVLAASWAAGSTGMASHRSAAALYGLGGGRRDIIEVTCLRWRRTRTPGLVVHETKALDMPRLVDGIPTTSAERTLLDLGAVCGFKTVLMAYDRAIKSRLTTWQEVRSTLLSLARSGRPGIVKLRTVLSRRSANLDVPESERETLMLESILTWGLPEPVAQFVVLDDGGEFVARVDLAYPWWLIAVEYDSDQEHSDPVAQGRDNRRRLRLMPLGLVVISVRSADLGSGGFEFCAAVRQVIRDRAPQVLASQDAAGTP